MPTVHKKKKPVNYEQLFAKPPKVDYKFRLKEEVKNDFMRWVLTLNPEDYPKYKSFINQYQKYKINARFQLLDLFGLYLEEMEP